MRAQPANPASILLALLSALAAACADIKGLDEPVNLDILQVLPASKNLEVGETATLGAQHVSGTTATNVTALVKWSTDDEKVLTVAYDPESGAVATAVGPGTAHVMASGPGGTATAEFVVRARAKTIELDKGIIEIAVGTTRTLQGVAITTNATKRAVEDGEWGTSQASIATVDSAGVVTAVAPGEAVISLTSSGLTTSQTIEVRDWKLESVSAEALNGTTLPFDQSTPIRVTGHFSGDHTQTLDSLFSFSAKDTPAATPATTTDGPPPLLTFKGAVATAGSAAGTSSVTGKGATGSIAQGLSVELTLTVVDAPLTALALDLPDHISTKGELITPTITGTYGSSLLFDTSAELSASPDTLVFVEQANGTIAPLLPGSVTITASVTPESAAGDSSDSKPQPIEATKTCTVVDSNVTAVAITAPSVAPPTLAALGTLALSASASFGADTTLDVTEPAIWTSDNESVAVVSNVHSGRVTGLSAGSANISATYHGVSATFNLTVTN